MADTKLSALSEVSLPLLTDVLYMADVAGPTSEKVSWKRGLGQLHHLCQGRLTLTSGTAVTTADVTGATSIYFTPYNGDQIAVFDGTRWQLYAFTEATIALGTLANATNYDIFAWDNAGTLSYKIGPAWTSATARGSGAGTTELALQNGVYVNNVAITSGPGAKAGRYLGSFRTTSTTTTEDSMGGVTTQVGGKRFLWNAQQRVRRPLLVLDTADSWAYGTNTWRVQNGATAPNNCVEVLAGLAQGAVEAENRGVVYVASNVSAAAMVGIGLNSSSAPSGLVQPVYYAAATPLYSPISAGYRGMLPLGYSYLARLEKGADGTSTFRGDDGGNGTQSGLYASIES